jgi:hypothetical protein
MLSLCVSSKIVFYFYWGISSAGRALDLHSRGQRFDPVILHQIINTTNGAGVAQG